ncbi:SDR family oxidoreductase [Paracoccus sp. IB05]|uniref:SDR family oxidoreductase n=1 Tax=Paracoccus sp. IB05 TaxID=2779367 RepID=UPI0018E8E580|nr:SDR family oxidoreductase [Paracoccus sp. IB05]MBJ2152238.1 SDR family oxidoreductase [Paracoccus sp. IB05]
MRNLWDETAASGLTGLALRAYSSWLIGQDPGLVLHGGGNTSWKSEARDLYGAMLPAIWVKAAGSDLGHMGEEGFTGLELAPLLALAELETLSDSAMVAAVKRARLDPDAAPAPIEALVHALIPAAFVDHCHADAVLTLSNAGGRALLQAVCGARLLILPYVKPGFELARQIRQALAGAGRAGFDAILLEHHGVFTWGETARQSYDRMIKICGAAEAWIAANLAPLTEARPEPDPLGVARLRGLVSRAAGRALIARPAGAVPPGEVATLAERARHGTLSPDHVIHLKPFPMLVGSDPAAGLAQFSEAYRSYAARAGNPDLIPLPDMPHWALNPDGSAFSFGPTLARARVVAEMAQANLVALRRAAQIGAWQGLTEAQLRDLEYWEPEQARLKRQTVPPVLAGRVAVVSGAAAGIGRATAEALAAAGAVVIGLDVDPSVRAHMNRDGYDSITADLTDERAVAAALDQVVCDYGGLDILVSNVGIFRAGAPVETLGDQVWDDTLAVNLTSHRKLLKQAIPFLRQGVDPAVVFIGSRNVAAPGPGAAAYSVSKAGLTQLMRVAALELAPEGIRVNAIHPDAVFDTRLWTPEALETSARRYGLTVEAYKSRNLMRAEVRSADVARAVLALVDGSFSRTTGAQIPVDGGNDRVI